VILNILTKLKNISFIFIDVRMSKIVRPFTSCGWCIGHIKSFLSFSIFYEGNQL